MYYHFILEPPLNDSTLQENKNYVLEKATIGHREPLSELKIQKAPSYPATENRGVVKNFNPWVPKLLKSCVLI